MWPVDWTQQYALVPASLLTVQVGLLLVPVPTLAQGCLVGLGLWQAFVLVNPAHRLALVVLVVVYVALLLAALVGLAPQQVLVTVVRSLLSEVVASICCPWRRSGVALIAPALYLILIMLIVTCLPLLMMIV